MIASQKVLEEEEEEKAEKKKEKRKKSRKKENKAGYTATLVMYGWAGAVLEKVTRAYGQEPYAQGAHKRQKK